MRQMAGIATHVEGGVATPVLRDIDPDVVAGQAEVFFARCPGCRFHKLHGIVRLVRIVALHAIAHCRRMHRLPSLHLLLVVAAEAKRLGRGRDQLDPRHIPVDPDFVAAQAPRRDRRMNRLSFALVFVALQALRRVHILFEGNRVSLRQSGRSRQHEQAHDLKYFGKASTSTLRCHRASTWSLGEHATLSFARPCPYFWRKRGKKIRTVTIYNRTSSVIRLACCNFPQVSSPNGNGPSPTLALVKSRILLPAFCDRNHRVCTVGEIAAIPAKDECYASFPAIK